MKRKNKMNKKTLIFIFGIIFLLGILNFTFALGEVCCEKTKAGAWCQMVQQSECASSLFAPTSCDQTDFCRLGTCINEQSGECSSNVPKTRCEKTGGIFDTRSQDEIASCGNGCCVFGDWVSFSNKAECKQTASQYGVSFDFMPEITNEFDCYMLGFPQDEGACLINEEDNHTTCRRITKEECNSIGGNFNNGFLCTAPQLETNCAKTSKTTCDEDGKIYYIDSCKNKANIYDDKMYSTSSTSWTPQMIDYWTYIKKPENSCTLTGDFSSSCGNCDSLNTGTICRTYSEAKENTANNQLTSPKFGNNVCASMDCFYDTNNDGAKEKYKHGESWCAETPGTYPHIQLDLNVGFTEDMKKKLSNVDKYNLPGSRYVKLMCVDGEVISEPCSDSRNEFCVEQPNSNNFKVGVCLANNWRPCTMLPDKTSCENPSVHCKWIQGYTFNGVNSNSNTQTNVNQTGSCVPLIAPGFDFWQGSEDAEACSKLGSTTNTAVYEVSIWQDRDELQKSDLCKTSGDNKGIDPVQRCFQNCYIIPDYGKESPSGNYMTSTKMAEIWVGENNVNLEKMCVSDRKGYYCEGKTGEVGGAVADCQKKDSQRSIFPFYWTNQDLMNSLRNRTRSLGDCGYKESAYKSMGVEAVSKDLETITVIFQKLKQDGSNKTTSESIKIYEGNGYIPGSWRNL